MAPILPSKPVFTDMELGRYCQYCMFTDSKIDILRPASSASDRKYDAIKYAPFSLQLKLMMSNVG